MSQRFSAKKMNESISLREFRESDRPALEQIIRETWNYDRFCSPQTAKKMAKVYLNSCLADQTYTQVAIAQNSPVGVIMAKNATTHRCSLHLRLIQLLSVFSLLSTGEGRSAFRLLWNVEQIDRELLDQCGPYDGELAFFAVQKDWRGLGIGKALFQSVVKYMRSQGISAFYLFTDTSCNYEFYERQGMKRRVSKEHLMKMRSHIERFVFFLYDYQIETTPV